MIRLENQEQTKATCPFCGAQNTTKGNRCENCGSLIDVTVIDNKETGNVEREVFTKTDVPPVNTANQNTPNNNSNYGGPQWENAYRSSQPNGFDPNMNKASGTGNFSYSNRPLTPPPVRGLSNAMKVSITAACSIIPGIGQIVGIVLSIIFMNASETDADCEDRRSFGLALLIACVAVVGFTCLLCFGFILLGMYSGGIY